MEARYQPPVQAAQLLPSSGFDANVERTQGAWDAFRAFQERVSMNPDQPEVLEAPLAHIRKCLDEMRVEDLPGNVTDKRVQNLYNQWRAIATGLQAHVGAGAGPARGIGADAMCLLASILKHNPFVENNSEDLDAAAVAQWANAGGVTGVCFTALLYVAATHSQRPLLSMPLEGPVSTLSDSRSKIDWTAVVPLELGPAFAASPATPSTRLCYDMARDGDFKTFQATHGHQFHAEVEENLNAIAARI
ncbi:hypothetical protein, partial [Variovorax saccharolyticus]|uniref:hypothetical protein n=1 Tax=Variovorax saccharolyticus TaxID=3053516 RepID=UPI0025791216